MNAQPSRHLYGFSATFVCALLVAGLLAFGWTPGHAQEPRLRVDVRLVLLNTHVLRPDGRPVAGLPIEQFRVYESGREQPVSVFLAGEAPVHVALLIDISGSTRESIGSLKKAAQQFVLRFAPQDRLALYAVGGDVRRVIGFTGEQQEVIAAIRKLRVEESIPRVAICLERF